MQIEDKNDDYFDPDLEGGEPGKEEMESMAEEPAADDDGYKKEEEEDEESKKHRIFLINFFNSDYE